MKKNFEDPRDSCQRSLTISKDLVARIFVKFRQRFYKQCISNLDEILIKSLANLKDFRTDRLLRSSLSFKEKFSSVRIFLIFEHPAKRCSKPDQEGLSFLFGSFSSASAHFGFLWRFNRTSVPLNFILFMLPNTWFKQGFAIYKQVKINDKSERFDCLAHEMLLIRDMSLSLDVQLDSI